jgi:hypothetical protein
MRGIEDHAAGGEGADVRGVEGGRGVIEFEIERCLVIREDEEDVRLAGFRSLGKESEREKGEKFFHGLLLFVGHGTFLSISRFRQTTFLHDGVAS